MKKTNLLLKLLSLPVILCLLLACLLSACKISTQLTEIKAVATKTEYEEGESFDVSGLTVTAKYSDGSSKEITEGYTIDKTGALTVDDTVITVKYEGKEAKINITVTAKPVVTLTGIEATATKTAYEEGESFDVGGLTVTAKYSDDTSKVITEGYTIDKTGALTPEDTVITVTYEGQEATVNITVTAKPVVTLTGIEATATKTAYEEGESFDVSGLTVTAKYSDNTSEVITEGYTIDKTGALTPEDTVITVTYEGKEAKINITVTAKPVVTLTGIEATATRTAYEEGESFDVSGLTVTAKYSDNTSKVITEGYTIDKTGALTPEDTVITVTYEGKEATINITVTAKPVVTLTGIEATATRTAYEEGESFDVTGLTVTAKYSDNTSKVITEGYTIDKTGALTPEDTIITVTYEGQQTTINITVAAKIKVTLSEEKDIATIELVENVPYYIVKGTYTGALTADMLLLKGNSGDAEIACAKIETEGDTVLMYFDISVLAASGGMYYPHLFVNGETWADESNKNGDIRNDSLTGGKTDVSVIYEEKLYGITEQYNMPCITVEAIVEATATISKDGCVDLEIVEGKPYYVIYGSYTGNLQAEHLSHYMERYQSKYTAFSFVRIADGRFRAYVDLSDMPQNTVVLPHLYFNGKDAGTDGANVNDNGLTCGKYIVCNGVRYTIYSKATGGAPYYGIACVMAEDASKVAVMLSLNCAGLTLEGGMPYYVLTGSYIGDLTKEKLELYDGSTVLPCEKLVLNEETGTFTAHFALKDYTGTQFYPHLKVDGVQIANGEDGGNICSTAGHVSSVDPITYEGKTYTLVLSANMPTVKVTENA